MLLIKLHLPSRSRSLIPFPEPLAVDRGLWEVAWGKDPDSFDKSEGVERGISRIDDFLMFPDVVPSSRNVMPKPYILEICWLHECEAIFIRPEYEEAEGFVLSACGSAERYRAVVVIGQQVCPSPA